MTPAARRQAAALRSGAAGPRPLRGRARGVRLGLLQFACVSDPVRNLRTACDLIRQAAGRGARIVVTPELFRSRYFPQAEDPRNFDLAEPIPGPTSRALGALARRLGIHLVASVFEKRAAGLYHNTAITIAPTGRVVERYRKMHVPDDPRFYEKYYFTPGSAGDHAADGSPWRTRRMGPATTGTLICWDQWYPEAARLMALQGADILFYPTAIAWHREQSPALNRAQLDAWVTVQRSHAIANGVFVAAVNRTGVEEALTFWGHSFVADPTGAVIAQAGTDEQAVLLADCDLGLIEQQRRGWPFLRDRRIDAYAGLLRRYGS